MYALIKQCTRYIIVAMFFSENQLCHTYTCLRQSNTLVVIFTTWHFPQHYSKSNINQYSDVIMTTMASQITSLAFVYSIVYSCADLRERQRSASLAFVRRIHRWPANFPNHGPVTRKMFSFDDVIMQWYTAGPECQMPSYKFQGEGFLPWHVLNSFCFRNASCSTSKLKQNHVFREMRCHWRHVSNFAERVESTPSIQTARFLDGATHGMLHTWNIDIHHHCAHW